MSASEIAQSIASAARGTVARLPTGKDEEYAVVIDGMAIVLVREFRSQVFGVSVLAQRAWSPRTIEETSTAVRESAALARQWAKAHPNGVTALDVAIAGTAAIASAHGSAPTLSTPGGQPAPTEMWLEDIGIFQQEDAVRVTDCGTLKDRSKLAGVCAKMVRSVARGKVTEQRLEAEKTILDATVPPLVEALNRLVPPETGAQWTLPTPSRPERPIRYGSWNWYIEVADVKFVKGVLQARAGLWGPRGFEVSGLDLARDLPAIVLAVRLQLSVLTPFRLQPSRHYRVLISFEQLQVGEVLRFVERIEEDHQSPASIFECAAQPGKQVTITDTCAIGRELDRYLAAI